MKIFARKNSRWLYPVLGGLGGLLYVLLDEGLMDQSVSPPVWAAVTHEFLDLILPVLLGITMGVCFYLIHRERQLSRRLSLNNDRLRQDILFNTLISQMLHEIQNPLHNLTAALEESETVAPEMRELVRRNLARLAEIKTQYGQWGSVLETIDPEQPAALDEFVRKFLDEKIGLQLRELGISPSVRLVPARVQVHPVFLEQILGSLLSNALSALEGQKSRRTLSIESSLSGPAVRLRLANSGVFPEAVLQSQGHRPVPSRDGLGLGLLLTRTLLEQVGGSLALSNADGCAVVDVTLKGLQP